MKSILTLALGALLLTSCVSQKKLNRAYQDCEHEINPWFHDAAVKLAYFNMTGDSAYWHRALMPLQNAHEKYLQQQLINNKRRRPAPKITFTEKMILFIKGFYKKNDQWLKEQ